MTAYLNHEAIERLAYQLWQDRGSPVGSPEIDWFRAKEELGLGYPVSDLRLSSLSFEPMER